MKPQQQPGNFARSATRVALGLLSDSQYVRRLLLKVPALNTAKHKLLQMGQTAAAGNGPDDTAPSYLGTVSLAAAAAQQARPRRPELGQPAPTIRTTRNPRPLPAGYRLFGHFLDADIEPFPALDLRSIYGAGPDGSPELYCADSMTGLTGVKLTLADSVPRPTADADASDAIRNERQSGVSKLSQALAKLHNIIADDLIVECQCNGRGLDAGYVFEETVTLVRWLYQNMIVNDFLPRLIGSEATAQLFTDLMYRYDGQPVPASVVQRPDGFSIGAHCHNRRPDSYRSTAAEATDVTCIASTVAQLLLANPMSYINVYPQWTPPARYGTTRTDCEGHPCHQRYFSMRDLVAAIRNY